MATYVNMLIQSGFLIKRLEEPKLDPDITDTDVQDQCRRPPFLVIAALKANPPARDGRKKGQRLGIRIGNDNIPRVYAGICHGPFHLEYTASL